MASVLVINSGSSSFKYQLIDAESEERLASGLVERIGEATGHVSYDTPEGHWERSLEIPDHTAGFDVMLAGFREHGPSLETHPPVAVGHRVVHGGARFFEPTLITPLVLINIEDLSDLAPLHNPANVEGIKAAQHAFPDLPQVAVFDTAFHQTMPPDAYTYALEASIAERLRTVHGVRVTVQPLDRALRRYDPATHSLALSESLPRESRGFHMAFQLALLEARDAVETVLKDAAPSSPEAAMLPIDTTSGLPESWKLSSAWRMISEANALPPSLSTRSTTALTLSSSWACRISAARVSPPTCPARCGSRSSTRPSTGS